LNRQLSKEIEMANEYMEKCSISLVIKEMYHNDTEIPSHPSKNGNYQENKQPKLMRMWGKGAFIRTGKNVYEISMLVPQ
jgi:hypothetical protein